MRKNRRWHPPVPGLPWEVPGRLTYTSLRSAVPAGGQLPGDPCPSWSSQSAEQGAVSGMAAPHGARTPWIGTGPIVSGRSESLPQLFTITTLSCRGTFRRGQLRLSPVLRAFFASCSFPSAIVNGGAHGGLLTSRVCAQEFVLESLCNGQYGLLAGSRAMAQAFLFAAGCCRVRSVAASRACRRGFVANLVGGRFPGTVADRPDSYGRSSPVRGWVCPVGVRWDVSSGRVPELC